jgi:hypothetical protein
VKQLLVLIALSGTAFGQAVPIAGFEVRGLAASLVTYKGKASTRLVDKAVGSVLPQDGSAGLALLKEAPFHNGTIEVNVAGQPAAGAAEAARGFVGIAFRVQGGGEKYEVIYLRPTNGRADDMLRRNHSIQYESQPEWPWSRLRSETPGVYESYVDLESGAWTNYRIVVKGTRAEAYVNGATQPCLIVKDLKMGDAAGAVALWVGPGTEAWFADLKITRQ